MPRKNRGYKKGEPFRDARLFVIACEGEKREKEYFEALVSAAIDRAAAADNDPLHHLPPAMSTKVYKLAEEIRAWLE